ncbi:hypothetical protein DFH07DRAFT_780431 [Mycena maculata]|uniref:Uncharacterized protein n=1 Tax=Mycena maculata TaxID=230809 RepID=A0AAD7I360_9AGAR|nr:hypothetical protein DFH07DRAFT_780431 [Mycena maculata]
MHLAAIEGERPDALSPSSRRCSERGRILFDGGPCAMCRRHTTELPYSFAPGIHICSLLTLSPAARLYRPNSIHTVLAELDSAELNSLIVMAETLRSTTMSYRSKQREVEEKNGTLLTDLSTNCLQVSSDATCSLAWDTICDTCLAEVALRMPRNNNCPFCSNWTTGDRLREHIHVSHPEHHVAMASKLHTCTPCPPSTRVFKLKNLRRHMESAPSRRSSRRDSFRMEEGWKKKWK